MDSTKLLVTIFVVTRYIVNVHSHPATIGNDLDPAGLDDSTVTIEETRSRTSLQKENEIVSSLVNIASELRTIVQKSDTSGFSWKNMVPSHFGELFEIVALLIHKKWHHDIVEAIEAVGEHVIQTEGTLKQIFSPSKSSFSH